MVQTVGKADICRLHTDRDTQSDREPPQPDCEHNQRHQGNPEGWGARNQKTAALDQPIGETAASRPGDHPERDPQHPGGTPCKPHQPDRMDHLFSDHPGNLLPVEQRNTEVPPEESRQPVQIPFYRRLPHAPVALQTSDLLRTHAAKGGLPDVRLKRVERGKRNQRECRHAHPQCQNYHPDQFPADPPKTSFQFASSSF